MHPLTGHLKYERLGAAMGAAARSSGVICNLFGEKDETQVIAEATPPLHPLTSPYITEASMYMCVCR